VHHDRPGLPWYSIPGVYRRQRDRLNVERFAGYSDVAARFLITPRQHPTGVAAGGRP
jgi:fatty acid desaturase